MLGEKRPMQGEELLTPGGMPQLLKEKDSLSCKKKVINVMSAPAKKAAMDSSSRS